MSRRQLTESTLQQIEQLRKHHKMTQVDIGRRLGLSRRSVQTGMQRMGMSRPKPGRPRKA